LTVVGLLQLDEWDVAVVFVEPAVVEPVDVVQGGDLDSSTVFQGRCGLISSVLYRPTTVSARALS
jgi:hypothetical protein